MTCKLLSIDVGTTSTRAIIFNEGGGIESICQNPLDLIYPQAGWVEQDPQVLVGKTIDAVHKVLKSEENTSDIVAAGITNQRETTILWDKKTGIPVYNAIVWQDRRTAKICEALKAKGLEKLFTKKTGLLLDPYFSATKICWLLDNIDGLRTRAENGEICFGTIDSWLIYKLTGGKIHATDATNASRTLLYNIVENKWDNELCKILNIPMQILPEVKECADNFGKTKADIFGDTIPILGVAGDQHAATIGNACFEKGMMKSTYGTGCFALLNTGSEIIYSKNRLLTTIAYKIDGQTTYALEGSIFNAGTSVQWLRDGLGIIADATECEELARSISDTGGVYLVPAFAGLGAPHWDAQARGALLGLTRGSGKAQIVRAALEAVVYQTRDLVGALALDGVDISSIRVDGGMVGNDWLMQFMADILGVSVERPVNIESTINGVAALAAFGIGLLPSLQEFSRRRAVDQVFKPQMSDEVRKELLSGWDNALQRVLVK
ncbi:MAG: glycerol kinase GlpK [Robiginitomaculum sp.]|nr:glycerol kinase GlpK [Robiginitomaculum sp.]